jgi:glycosyltransferase involved in cell wall biosynthesis
MAHKPRIALVSTYSHPSRDSIERMLTAAFPEFDLDNISVSDVVKRHRAWIAPNMCYVGMEYGRAIARRQTTVRGAYLTTTYAFVKLHEAMRELIDPHRHAFSFQTQSLYDTSVPGVPHFIYTDHTHLSNLRYPDFDRTTLRSRNWLALERTIYEHATTVFTRSTNIAADLRELYEIHEEKIECVYAGANVTAAEPDAANPTRYAAQRILFVGIEWERKGGPELAQAFRRVIEVHPNAHLTIAGADVSVNLPNCTVVGHVSAEQLARLYAQSSVFCLPTKREPFGIAFVEAMLYGLPIVGTRIGAVPDMVQDGVNGYLVQPGSADDLANALCRLLADPDSCRTLGQRGYERATQFYTWSGTGERIRSRVLRMLDAESHRESPPPVIPKEFASLKAC